MSDIKYIYWFSYYNLDSPSVRYRGKYPLEFFKENYNIDSSLIIPGYAPKRAFSFFKSYCSALFFRKDNSVIVIQRVHSGFIYSSLLKLLVSVRKKDTVYDLDDADYLYCKTNSIYFFAKKCSRITAGSQAIANHLSKFNNNILITSSPTPDLQIVKKKKSAIFTIGWIGDFGGDHKKSLVEIVFPAVKALDFKCKLILLGVTKSDERQFVRDYFGENENVHIEIPENTDWQNEHRLQQKISSFDIGISTLVDNEIQRSKSGIKAKQYLNNGVPVLATNLPENDWVVKEGINGFFCSTIEEFNQRIVEFYKMDDPLYDDFSKNARKSICEFDHQKYYLDFMK
jgi:glycosyltransferase involved in cell wall biosynthesis